MFRFYIERSIKGGIVKILPQGDRAINWKRDKTDAIVARINAAGSAPGVLDTLFGPPFYLYDAHHEDHLKGAPGQLIAQRNGAVCVATVDGAIWITHLKAKGPETSGRATQPSKATESPGLIRSMGMLLVFRQESPPRNLLIPGKSRL
jgi:Formyl transferase, C-terminal domain